MSSIWVEVQPFYVCSMTYQDQNLDLVSNLTMGYPISKAWSWLLACDICCFGSWVEQLTFSNSNYDEWKAESQYWTDDSQQSLWAYMCIHSYTAIHLYLSTCCFVCHVQCWFLLCIKSYRAPNHQRNISAFTFHRKCL